MGDAPVQEREVLDWATYGRAARELAAQIVADGYEPDLVLAISRGGLFLGGSLGYALAVKNIFVLNVELYTGVGERLPVPIVLPPHLDPTELRDQRVLVADDVADTGTTLALVQAFCAPQVAEVRTAVLYEKPQSEVRCEYVWRPTDRWINFPWSSEPPLVERRATDA